MRARKKNPIIAAILGTVSAAIPKYTIIMLLRIAKKKLLAGAMIRLEIAIGIVKTNNERPFDSCSGVSLNENTKVSSKRNKKDAIRLERLLM
jgi:hypothetical protein